MKPKHFVIISIPCQSTEELQKAKEAVLFHLETLNPEFSTEGTRQVSREVKHYNLQNRISYQNHLVIQRQKVLKNEKTCIFQQFFVPLRCISIKMN